MPAHKKERFCPVCGVQLAGYYYYVGRCSKHTAYTEHNKEVDDLAVAARKAGMSYGKYVAMTEQNKPKRKGCIKIDDK